MALTTRRVPVGAGPSPLLLNPAFLYGAVWAFVLWLYSLELSELLEPLRPATILLIVGTSLAFIAGCMLEAAAKGRRLASLRVDRELLRERVDSAGARARLKFVWVAFWVGISFEIVYFGGVPLLGLLGIGPEILYTDFGIPGVHGLLNSLFYAACAVQFTRVLTGVSRKSWLLTCVSLGYPALAMSRQVLISILLQYLFIYLSVRRPSPALLLRTGLIFIVTFLAFGYFGDIRSGRENIIALAAPSFEYPQWLPSAFIWFYLYLATPLNNVNFNIDITPNYFPLETVGTFIPSFARESFIGALGGTRPWDLVSESFNVSSLLQSLLTDFGIAGSIAFTLLCGLGFSRLLRRSRRSPAAFFAVIVLLHGIALSFFANLLFHLVFMFQIATIGWIVSRGRRRTSR